jgi:8-hydroxy-5-deazaflavin:NADPH oxidoreductase
MHIGLIGGTGREGRGLALRWAKAGHTLAIGSRDAERAKARAEELRVDGVKQIAGGDNAWAASVSEVVLLAVPYGAHRETLEGLKGSLEGRILIDITVPLKPPRVGEVHLPPGQAAALEAQAIVGPSCKVVAALHHVSSSHLSDPDATIDTDVLVCSDDNTAREVAMRLIGDLGLFALDAGPLRNAVALEALTPVLIHLNKRYKVPGAGVRFSGLNGARKPHE